MGQRFTDYINISGPKSVRRAPLGLGQMSVGTPAQVPSRDIASFDEEAMLLNGVVQPMTPVERAVSNDLEVQNLDQILSDIKKNPIRAPKLDQSEIEAMQKLSDDLQNMAGVGSLPNAQRDNVERIRSQMQDANPLAFADLSGVYRFADQITGGQSARGYQAPADINQQYADELLKLAQLEDAQRGSDLGIQKERANIQRDIANVRNQQIKSEFDVNKSNRQQEVELLKAMGQAQGRAAREDQQERYMRNADQKRELESTKLIQKEIQDFNKSLDKNKVLREAGSSLLQLDDIANKVGDTDMGGIASTRTNIAKNIGSLVGLEGPAVRFASGNETANLLQSLSNLENVILQDRSGAAVTAQELQRLKNEISDGKITTAEGLRNAINRLKQAYYDDISRQATSLGPAAQETLLNRIRESKTVGPQQRIIYEAITGEKLPSDRRYTVTLPSGKVIKDIDDSELAEIKSKFPNVKVK